MTVKNTFTYITTPGHGYLKVPLAKIAELGIENKLSNYSGFTGLWAYLEEDCDAGVFLEACGEHTLHETYSETFDLEGCDGYLGQINSDFWQASRASAKEAADLAKARENLDWQVTRASKLPIGRTGKVYTVDGQGTVQHMDEKWVDSFLKTRNPDYFVFYAKYKNDHYIKQI